VSTRFGIRASRCVGQCTETQVNLGSGISPRNARGIPLDAGRTCLVSSVTGVDAGHNVYQVVCELGHDSSVVTAGAIPACSILFDYVTS
jgi:hypothetical protein